MKIYGSINNRIDENKMFCKEIEVGTGVTIYGYTDRHAYEVTKVINQKNVFIREYDHELDGEPMSNDWKLISNPRVGGPIPSLATIFLYKLIAVFFVFIMVCGGTAQSADAMDYFD